MYGIDIAKQRFDEQDKQIIQHVLSGEWKIKKCLILGSGEGRIGIVLALLGFEVVCMDVDDYSDFYLQANKLFSFSKPIQFIQKSIVDLERGDYSKDFSLILGQRVFHYMKYSELQNFLDILPSYMSKKSFLYTAVSCVDSILGEGYEAAAQPLEDRFGMLSLEMQERFSLSVRVCLYSFAEYKKIMSQTHFKKKKLYQTSFGNIKGCYQL